IFPLKRFCGGGTAAADGTEMAYDVVRLKLQEIVDHENKRNPFSDDELVAELAKHGLTVARRTVTKYRKAMNIPSSRQRRDWSLPSKENGSAASAPPVAQAPAAAGNDEARMTSDESSTNDKTPVQSEPPANSPPGGHT